MFFIDAMKFCAVNLTHYVMGYAYSFHLFHTYDLCLYSRTIKTLYNMDSYTILYICSDALIWVDDQCSGIGALRQEKYQYLKK